MNLLEQYQAVLDHLRSLVPSREISLAITKLEESAMWAACGVSGVTLPIDLAGSRGRNEMRRNAVPGTTPAIATSPASPLIPPRKLPPPLPSKGG